LAPAGALAISPRDVATSLVSTKDAKKLLCVCEWPFVFNVERRRYRELVISLAQELYHRERGVSAPSEEALVGTYLKSLPDDGWADLDDGTAPTVA
jgi:hypothetical protein